MDDGEEVPANVTLRFVIPKGKTEATCSEELAFAFENAQEQELSPKWISHDETLNILHPVKTDVFVMDPFDGPAFDHVSKFKCTVVGPRCLLTCLQKGQAVPNLPYPVYTAAMRDLIITSTGFTKERKQEIKTKVEQMGGVYSNVFHDAVTHLIAEVVRSRKYDVAVNKETPVMLSDWVDTVWERGKLDNIHATDKQFARYKCPALFGLNITVSQMNKKDREALKRSIESHGGIYSGSLDMNTTVILIITKPEGDKYKYARRWKIPCVTSDWVLDCIERGYCLPTESYRMEPGSGSCSTPTKENASKMLAEVSMCSTILMPNDTMITQNINETINMSNMSILPGISSSSGGRDKSVEQLLESLDLGRVKKAGPFLEDCKLFLSGFSDAEAEFLEKVIVAANGHRMKQLTKSVTHFVGCRPVPDNIKIMESLNLTPYKVGLQWVVESMLMGQPVPESDFPLQSDESRTTMGPPIGLPFNYDETLPAARKRDPKPKKLTLEQEQSQYEDDLLAQYKVAPPARKQSEDSEEEDAKFAKPTALAPNSGKAAAPPPPEQASENSTMSSMSQKAGTQDTQFLDGLKIFLSGFNSEMEVDLSDWIHEAGGEIVSNNYSKVVDYLIVPVQNSSTNMKAKETVTNLWLENCLDSCCLVPVQYFHRPIKDSNPLAGNGVVIGITNYTGYERQHIVSVAESLGMISQEIFAKRDKNEAKKSTHLVCASPEGPKYDAAIKWKLPVVTKDWLMACYADKEWVSEKPFLVGDSKTFTPGKPMPKPPSTVSESNGIENEDDDEDEVSFAPPSSLRGRPTATPRGNPTAAAEKSPESSPPQPQSVTPASSSRGGGRNLRTPSNGTTMQIGFDTPAAEKLDIEKLRPKPLDFDLTSALTPQPTYYADSQPSPSVTAAQKRKRDDDDNLPFFLQGMKTPDTPYGAFLGVNPSPSTRKFWKRQCDELGRYEMTAEEREEWEADNARRKRRHKEGEERAAEAKKKHENFAFQSTAEDRERLLEKHKDEMEKKGLVVLSRDPRSFEDIMEERWNKMGKSWKNPAKRIKLVKGPEKETPVLQGVVLFVTKKLAAMQSELHEIVSSLGGEHRHSYCPEVTHVVFLGKANDSTKEFRVAKTDKKLIVAPDWVFMCQNEKKRVEEDIFPHTYNPKMTLSSTLFTQSSSKPTQRRTNVHQHKEETRMEVSPEKEEEKEREKSVSDAAMPDLSADLQKLDELVELSKDNSTAPRRSMKMTLTTNDSTPERSVSRHSNVSDVSVKDDIVFSTKTQSEVSDTQIQWIDPREEAERKKLDAKLSAETQAPKFNTVATETEETFDSMEIPENLTEAMMEMEAAKEAEKEAVSEDKENRKSSANDEDKTKKKMRFMLSGVQDEEKNKFMEFLNNHGVDCGDLGYCDPEATHVVAIKLSRSEKMLGSIASGKWLLHHSYISMCMKHDKLLAEAEFEWGNPANSFLDKLTTPIEKKLAEASYRWRVIIQKDPRRGVFDGIRAIIHTSDSRKDAFKRLLELGKGRVVTNVVPPYRDPKDATHCIAEPQKLPRMGLDYLTLAAKGVAVVGPFYINEYLTSDPPPKVEAHLIDEFKPVWEKRKRT